MRLSPSFREREGLQLRVLQAEHHGSSLDHPKLEGESCSDKSEGMEFYWDG